MAEQAVWRLKQLALSIPTPSVAVFRALMVGPALLLGLLAALVASQLTTSLWRGEAKVVVLVEDPSPLLSGSSVPESETALSLARSQQLARRVVRDLAVPGLTARQFLRDSSVKPTPDSAVLAFSVSYRQRTLTLRLTNEYVRGFIGLFASLQKRWRNSLGRAPNSILVQQSSPPRPTVAVVDPAHVAGPFRPHVLRNEFLAGVFGALLGVALAVGVGRRRGSSG